MQFLKLFLGKLGAGESATVSFKFPAHKSLCGRETMKLISLTSKDIKEIIMFDFKRHHQSAYEDALSLIPNGKGCRNSKLLPAAAWHAAKLGMDKDEFVQQVLDASAGSDPLSRSEIRRAFESACAKVGKSDLMGKWREIRKLEQLGTPDYVPHLIRAGGHRADADALREMSPVDVKSLRSSPSAQTVAFLSALWRPKDYLHIFTIARPSRGKPGSNLMWQEVWVRGYQFRTPKGDGIIPNPFTGAPSVNADGIESYITKDCLAGYPYALVEFDALPLGLQCAFWLGFLQKSKYRDRLASLVYSGGKSIHALLHIDAPDIFAHEDWRTRLCKLFASNSDKAFCADPAGFLPRQGTRLAGARRNGDGPVQELLYLKAIVCHP